MLSTYVYLMLSIDSNLLFIESLANYTLFIFSHMIILKKTVVTIFIDTCKYEGRFFFSTSDWS